MKRSERKALEAELARLGDEMPQIDLSEIKRRHVVTPEVVSHKRKPSFARRLLPALCVACCALLMIGAPAGFFAYDAHNTTTVYIETTETAMLTVGASGKVKEVSYQSGGNTLALAEGTSPRLLSDAPATADLRGMEGEDAIKLVIDHMTQNGSMEDGCEVVVSTVCKNNERGNKIAERVGQAVREKAEKLIADIAVVVEKNMERKPEKAADGTERSPARDRYLSEVMDTLLANGTYTVEELENFSTGFLRYLCAEHDDDDKDMEDKERHPFSDKAKEYYERYKEQYGKKTDDDHGAPNEDDDQFPGFPVGGEARPGQTNPWMPPKGEEDAPDKFDSHDPEN